MVHNSLRLEQLEDGVPLLSHQNALSYVFSTRSKNKFPTQLVYPDSSITIGLKPSLNFSDTQNTVADREEDDDAQQVQSGSLVVYASPTPYSLVGSWLNVIFCAYIICILIELALLCSINIVQSTARPEQIAIYAIIIAIDFVVVIALKEFKSIFLTQLLMIAHSVLLFIGFTLTLYSVLDFVFYCVALVKIIPFKRMIDLMAPQVFVLKAGTTS